MPPTNRGCREAATEHLVQAGKKWRKKGAVSSCLQKRLQRHREEEAAKEAGCELAGGGSGHREGGPEDSGATGLPLSSGTLGLRGGRAGRQSISPVGGGAFRGGAGGSSQRRGGSDPFCGWSGLNRTGAHRTAAKEEEEASKEGRQSQGRLAETTEEGPAEATAKASADAAAVVPLTPTPLTTPPTATPLTPPPTSGPPPHKQGPKPRSLLPQYGPRPRPRLQECRSQRWPGFLPPKAVPKARTTKRDRSVSI